MPHARLHHRAANAPDAPPIPDLKDAFGLVDDQPEDAIDLRLAGERSGSAIARGGRACRGSLRAGAGLRGPKIQRALD